jgi:hypothetical protein
MQINKEAVMSYDGNVFYHPEVHGLTVVAELEFSDLDYQFDTRVVWKDESGVLYTARDSGCSCPTPFEDYTSVQDLERVNIKDLENEVESEKKNKWGNPDLVRDSRDFLETVRAAL